MPCCGFPVSIDEGEASRCVATTPDETWDGALFEPKLGFFRSLVKDPAYVGGGVDESVQFGTGFFSHGPGDFVNPEL